MMTSTDFALDLGNNNTLIFDKEHVLFSQPTCIVVNENRSTYAIGDKAIEMYERTHDNIRAVKPLRGGVIAEYEYAVQMLREMVNQTFPNKGFLNRFQHIISGIPYSTSEVEKRALRDAIGQFNARSTHLVFEPLAAALGMGLDVKEPDGKCIVDIGGGITEIVIISLSGIVTHESIRVAGDTFTEEIQDHFRRQHNLSIGFQMAEKTKLNAGAALKDLSCTPQEYKVIGKDLLTGIPRAQVVASDEIAEVLDRSLAKIEECITRTLEICPPELSSDIYANGIYVTGGGSLLSGLKKRFEDKFTLDIHLDPTPLLSVSKGLSQILGESKKHQAILMD